MHDTAQQVCECFAHVYGRAGFKVLDVGSRSVNGHMRGPFEECKMEYIGMDMEPGENVDVLVAPGKPFPFENGAFDLVISTSTFEHDPTPMLTFREMCRVTKLGGFIYVNAPCGGGPYHGHPGDNWRFYSDAAQSFAYGSSIKMFVENDKIQAPCAYPAHVEETAHCLPLTPGSWVDWFAVWKRVDEPQVGIVVSSETRHREGPLLTAVHLAGCRTCPFVP